MKKEAAGSLYLIVIGLLLAGAGGVFTWLLGASFERARAMDQWSEQDCYILESELREQRLGPDVPTEYRFGLLFGYEFEGAPYSSENLTLRENAWVKEPAKIQALINNFPAGSRQTCYVNPENPEQAVLKKETKAPGYSIWFPMLFVVGGLGVMVKALITLFSQKKEEPAPSSAV